MDKLEHILPPFWRDEIKRYLRDDCPHHDVQGFVVGSSPETAVLLAKSPDIIVAGKPFFTAVFEELGCSVDWLVEEGATVITVPAKIAYVRGPCRNILLGERTALNIIARASGIASAAKELVSLAKSAGWHGEVAGTRKVTPGFRMVEKYALLVGGASTHRMDLSSMVMLKGEAGVVRSLSRTANCTESAVARSYCCR
jgi:nicotinate-nucleotide pyrophosphorylase (carboxylating)